MKTMNINHSNHSDFYVGLHTCFTDQSLFSSVDVIQLKLKNQFKSTFFYRNSVFGSPLFPEHSLFYPLFLKRWVWKLTKTLCSLNFREILNLWPNLLYSWQGVLWSSKLKVRNDFVCICHPTKTVSAQHSHIFKIDLLLKFEILLLEACHF